MLTAFRKMFSLRTENHARKLVLRLIVVLLLVMGIKNSFSNEIGQKILAPVTGIKSGYTISTENKTQTTELYDTTKLSSNITIVPTTTGSLDDSTSLEDYLGNLICTACHRGCSLLNPRCSRGVSQADQAQAQYNSLEEQSQSVVTQVSTSGVIATEVAGAKNNKLYDAFSELLPLMTLYVAGTYYTVELLNKRKKA